eukprot:Gb_15381 [translate_table: standard]
MVLHCVNCGSMVNALLVQYSPGNTRLTKCTKCKAVADEYIECEMMILLVDLILHKPKAYRHLFFNLPHLNMLNLQDLVWKAASVFLLLDACRQLVLNQGKVHSESSGRPISLLVTGGKLTTNIFLNNLIFFFSLLLVAKLLQKRQVTSEVRYMEIFMAVLFSSYFKLFIIAMMVWDFPTSAVFIIDAFTLSSNVVAVKVMMHATTLESVGLCFIGHSTKLLTNLM